MSQCNHEWNYQSSKTDGLFYGYPCQNCSALITETGEIIEPPEVSAFALYSLYFIFFGLILVLTKLDVFK